MLLILNIFKRKIKIVKNINKAPISRLLYTYYILIIIAISTLIETYILAMRDNNIC